MPSIEYGKPDYGKLKCPRCGNTTEFIEFSLWEGRQALTVRDGEPDYTDAWEGLDADQYPRGVWCGRCEREDGEEIVVWAVSDF